MGLESSSSYSKHFINSKRLLFDSDILIDLINNGSLSKLEGYRDNGYSVVYSFPSILEIGMGTDEIRNTHGYTFSSEIYQDGIKNGLNGEDLYRKQFLGEKVPSKFAYIPTAHEWFFAKSLLIDTKSMFKIQKENNMRLQLDAIIFASAWNSGSVLVTNNISDFMKFNKVQDLRSKNKARGYRYLPLFTFNDLEESLEINKKIIFPQNIDKRFLN